MSHLTNLPLGQGPEMIQEHWCRFFCEKEEHKELVNWLHQEGLSRPVGFEDRLAHAEKLRKMGNQWYEKSDLRRALHCLMGAVHSLDYSPSEQLAQEAPERDLASQSMMTIMSNLAMVFLKRGDFVNADKAGTAGLRCSDKLPIEDVKPIKAKLLYRRALARAEASDSRDLTGARQDLVEAIKLEPNNSHMRECLTRCTEMLSEERANDPIRYRPFSAKKGEAATEDDGPTASSSSTAAAQAEASAASSSTSASTNSGSTKPRPEELPPALEKFAEVVGRCLGRSRRTCRRLRRGEALQVLKEAKDYKIFWVFGALLSLLLALQLSPLVAPTSTTSTSTSAETSE